MKGLPLQKLAAAGVKIAFGLTVEAQIDVTLHIAPTKTYDAEHDTEVQSGGATVPTKAIKYRSKSAQDREALDIRSHTLAVSAAAIGGRDISQTDYVIEPDGKWEIVSADTDPAKALWILEVRR